MDFVEICNVCIKKVITKAAKRIFNSDKICRSYCDFYFGVTFFGTHCIMLATEYLGLQSGQFSTMKSFATKIVSSRLPRR